MSRQATVTFEGEEFHYPLKTDPEKIGTKSCEDIKTLTYEKPGQHKAAHRRNGLISGVINIFSVAKSVKAGKQLNFKVQFIDGRFIEGQTDFDTYFAIQNKWIEVR